MPSDPPDPKWIAGLTRTFPALEHKNTLTCCNCEKIRICRSTLKTAFLIFKERKCHKTIREDENQGTGLKVKETLNSTIFWGACPGPPALGRLNHICWLGIHVDLTRISVWVSLISSLLKTTTHLLFAHKPARIHRWDKTRTPRHSRHRTVPTWRENSGALRVQPTRAQNVLPRLKCFVLRPFHSFAARISQYYLKHHPCYSPSV